jgi:hypothetical protein
MADVIKRIWRSGPRKVKRIAWGYTLQKDGKQIRVTRAGWTEDDAQKALAAAILERDAASVPPAPVIRTLGKVAQEYLDFKRGKGKRSIRQDEQIVGKLKRGLGADTPLQEITAQRIAQYDRDRVSQTSRLGRNVTPSTVNRELAILRHGFGSPRNPRGGSASSARMRSHGSSTRARTRRTPT